LRIADCGLNRKRKEGKKKQINKETKAAPNGKPLVEIVTIAASGLPFGAVAVSSSQSAIRNPQSAIKTLDYAQGRKRRHCVLHAPQAWGTHL